jgi:hypothetical protein
MLMVWCRELDNNSDEFVAAAQTMKSSDNESRKHKMKSNGKKIKFIVQKLNQNVVPI